MTPGDAPLLAGERDLAGTAHVPAGDRVEGSPAPGTPRSAPLPPGQATTDYAIVTEGLTKRFRGGQVAVNGLNLAVPRGAVYGFLGPNGSGKTTTIRMLLGLVAPTEGGCEVLGHTMPGGLAEALPRVGALVEGPAFYPYLSGEANLRRFDAADPYSDRRTARERIGAALDRVGLSAAAGKRYRAYSLGMRQRLAIAAALLGPRELLILDEPTNGLDPASTREVRALVRQVAAGGTTVFVSSHLLTEVEQMCTHVGVMRAGHLVADGPIEELRAGREARIRVETPDVEKAAAVLGSIGLTDVRAGEGEASAVLGDGRPDRVCADLVAADVAVHGLAVVRPSLEDVFVGLTGEGFDVDG
ncbi:ABC transporter ATP-binding protein [Spongiactinospora sp. TRM90649]|uniref:ABC transporter ATP-binding protein n=1 Tax=Spongiactinospora sp. TRM90649 TaxID=3031114 RepID=UPI0023F79B64|nr:ABC transporter ATP-binding protein [Spongiactinospora sp. TRM90649]MDF5753908.1 ABC transporter ATP-binding protein [Spongiactinospora sp. TRM90649]